MDGILNRCTGTETSAHAHARHIHYGLQDLLRTPDPHRPPLHQTPRSCTCKLCWAQQTQRLSSHNFLESPSPHVDRELYCVRHLTSGSKLGFHDGVDCTEESRLASGGESKCAFCPPAKNSSRSAVSNCFSTPCCHSDLLYVPRTPQSEDSSMGGFAAQETASVGKLFPPTSYSPAGECKQRNLGMASMSKESGNRSLLSSQVILYNWYLIRRDSSSHGAEVSVGGFFELGTMCMERFETTTIVKRIEKCRLVAQDGVEVRLVGLIDDCTTVSNGFSLDIVQSFLSGFPYVWNHLLINEFSASNTRHPDHHIPGSCGLSGAGEMSQLSFEGCLNEEKQAPIPAQQTVSWDHLEKANNLGPNSGAGMKDETQSEKENTAYLEKEAVVLINQVFVTQPPLVEMEKSDSGHLKIEQNLSSQSVGTFQMKESDNATDITESCLEETASFNQRTSTAEPKPGRPSQSTVTFQMKETDNAIDFHESCLVEDASFNQSRSNAGENPGRASKTSGSCEQNEVAHDVGNALMNKSNDSTGSVGKVVDKGRESKQKMQPTTRITRSMQQIKSLMEGVPVSKKNRRNIPGGMSLNASLFHSTENVESTIAMDSRLLEKKKGEHEVLNSNPGQSADEITQYSQEVASSAASEGLGKSSYNLADPNLKAEGHLINQEGACSGEAALEVNDNSIEEHDEENLLECEQKTSHQRVKNSTKDKLHGNSPKKESSLRSSGQGSINRRTMIPPPLPCPRVMISRGLVSEAFGLKTSRSGRILVPPLAHWCSQSLLRDKDGGIIAISDGSKDTSNDDTGYFKFKPPAEAALQRLQKRLRKAATESTSKRRKR